MQKVDLAITIVGAVAVLATVLGVVLYEDLAGAEELTFRVVEEEGAFTGEETGVGAGDSPVEFGFELPDNATAAAFDITVDFTGTSGQGDTITFTAQIVGPNNTGVLDEDSTTMTVEANQNGGASATLSLAGSWAEVPVGGNTTDIDTAAQEAALSWDEPLFVRITISSPSGDNLVGVPQLGVNYQYDITVNGDLTRFERVVPAPPEVTGGQ